MDKNAHTQNYENRELTVKSWPNGQNGRKGTSRDDLKV